MHYTLRLTIQRGTPTDSLREPYVHVERETLDDTIDALVDIAREADEWRTRHPAGSAASLDLILRGRHADDFEDGLEPWSEEDRTQREILASVREARQRVQLVYDGGMGTNDELGEALATLAQTERWLTNQEVPT